MAALGTRLLTIEVGGSEYKAEVSNVRITSGASDSDFTSFADAASGGGREYKLAMTLVQDLATGSLWREVWDNTGTEVPFTLAPYGNAAPAAGQGHVVGNAVISEPDGDLLGGEANASTTARFTIDVEWSCTAKPTLDEAP